MSSETSPSKLVTLFKGIEKPISSNGFSDELKIQKITYLAQASGIDLGYSFEWYIRGPYCRQVSDHVSEIINAKTALAGTVTLNESRITEFGKLLGPHIHDADWLEIAGSLVYLYHENYAERRLKEIVGCLLEDLIFSYKNFGDDLVCSVIGDLHRKQLIK